MAPAHTPPQGHRAGATPLPETRTNVEIAVKVRSQIGRVKHPDEVSNRNTHQGQCQQCNKANVGLDPQGKCILCRVHQHLTSNKQREGDKAVEHKTRPYGVTEDLFKYIRPMKACQAHAFELVFNQDTEAEHDDNLVLAAEYLRDAYLYGPDESLRRVVPALDPALSRRCLLLWLIVGARYGDALRLITTTGHTELDTPKEW